MRFILAKLTRDIARQYNEASTIEKERTGIKYVCRGIKN
jgi:hypothetical protein